MRTVLYTLFAFIGFTLATTSSARSIETSSAVFSNNITTASFFGPVHWEGFDARVDHGAIRLDWKIAREENVVGFEVERSKDSNSFKKIGYHEYQLGNEYTFADYAPVSGSAYYRIKSIDKDGKTTYSAILRISTGKAAPPALRAFPVPAQKTLNLVHASAGRGATITITGQSGNLFTALMPEAGAQQSEIDLSQAKPGMYIVRYNDGNGKTEILKIIRQ